MKVTSKIFVAGHNGLVGSALVRCLRSKGYDSLVLRSRKELDLTDAGAVRAFFERERPEYVFLAAAKVGGIRANNTFPADFIYQNLQIQNSVIHASYVSGVEKLCFLGSSCIYPRDVPQPMKEEYLMSGALESTNEAYAISKIAGIKMVQAYHRQYGFNAISLMPTNLYGPQDNFDLESSHVLPSLLRKVVEAKERRAPAVEVWGTGNPRREFLHADDLAQACIFLMNTYNSPEIINVGVGEDVTIRELAELIKEEVGYAGSLRFDPTKPDGTPRKLLDISKIRDLGWEAKISLREGIRHTIDWYLQNRKS